MSLDGVGKTSLLIAAMRAVESGRSDDQGRLFSDPFAEKLAGAEGFALRERGIAAAGDVPAIALRTKYIDDRLSKALAAGLRQIVILAAGMDARAYRLSYPVGTTLFEIDRTTVIDYKNEKLKFDNPRVNRIAICCDLRDDWETKLRQAGFNPNAPTFWMTEGLLMYLEESSVKSIYTKMHELSAPGSLSVADVMGRSMLESPYMENQLNFVKNLGAPWIFGTDDPEAFFGSLGWKVTTVHPSEVAPERWPFPVAPRAIPGIPRSFFMEAQKV